MGKPYSLDFRTRVAAVLNKGLSCNQVAKQFGIGVSTANTMCESDSPKRGRDRVGVSRLNQHDSGY